MNAYTEVIDDLAENIPGRSIHADSKIKSPAGRPRNLLRTATALVKHARQRLAMGTNHPNEKSPGLGHQGSDEYSEMMRSEGSLWR